ncbi:MAG TPA: TM2 domain-containing protein [Prolixibacteraceae bacterium]|nr:TM2 domain-containing protein [Prolixibacteraceae bacterium]
MRKIVLLLVVILAVMVSQQAKASAYHVDEISVDQLFDNAVETSMFDFNAPALNTVAANASSSAVAGKDPIIALALNFFFGYLGAHRFYLGTELLTGIAYIVTFGGFGVLYVIDLIALLVKFDNIAPFVNNPSLFMWKGVF